eukprot:comp20062_c0_seq1/m.24667 comp20062_c0_seq1/g.24667  ORF comp20062_c0_seq1/g.24667 comp20062_c0_seq1/m.24667 type:complete len:458 (-) comp20062_c0_seq1:1-1374(-)
MSDTPKDSPKADEAGTPPPVEPPSPPHPEAEAPPRPESPKKKETFEPHPDGAKTPPLPEDDKEKKPEQNTRPRSKRHLVILDVNGILIDRRRESDRSKKPESAKIGNFYVYDRPHMREVVDILTQDFEVAIWSSMMPHNLDKIVEHAFGETSSKLLFVWDQSRCTRLNAAEEWRELHGAPMSQSKPVFLKELSKVEAEPPYRKFFPDHVLLIDDSPYKVVFNKPYMAIHPSAYNVDTHGDEDVELLLLKEYLKRLRQARSVPEFVCENPFDIWKSFQAHLLKITERENREDVSFFLDWCMRNREHVYAVVSIWEKELLNAPNAKKHKYINLVDEIVRKDRSCGSQDYAQCFWAVFPRTTRHAAKHGTHDSELSKLLGLNPEEMNKHVVSQFDKVFEVRKYLFPHIPRTQSLSRLWRSVEAAASRNEKLRPPHDFLREIVPVGGGGGGEGYGAYYANP